VALGVLPLGAPAPVAVAWLPGEVALGEDVDVAED